MDEVVIERQHATLVVVADVHLVHLAALLVDRGEMLLAVLGPFDRPAELHRRVRHEQLVGVEQHDLRPEASADIGRDDLYLGLGQPEQHGEPAADRGRRLGRVVDGQLPFVVRPAGPHRPRLHRAGGAALVSEVKALASRRRLEGRRHAALLLHQLRRDVAGHVVMDEVVGARGDLGRDDDRQRLVVDLDQLGRVLGDRATLGDHEHDRLARVAHHLGGEASLRAAVGEVGMRDEDGQVGSAEGQVVRGVDGDHARHGARGADVDRPDARVGMWRAHEH